MYQRIIIIIYSFKKKNMKNNNNTIVFSKLKNKLNIPILNVG